MKTGSVHLTKILGLFAVTVATGCLQVGEPAVDPHGTGVEDHAEVEEHAASEGQEVRDSSLPFVASVPVLDRLGPGGTHFQVARRTSERVGHQRTIGRTAFSIAMRSENLTYYPCSSCHATGARIRPGDRAEDVHQDIQPIHPSENNAVCGACHMADNPEMLTLAGTDPVPLNEAYRLCAQCHFIQVDAWAGGAHGKRLDTWRGPRVVMGCTDCHNPHDPGIPTRNPYPGPRIPRTGPKQP